MFFWGDIQNEIGTSVVTYSNIQGGYGTPEDNNINLNPRFVGIGNHPYNLSFNSPCINAGDPYTPIDDEGSTDITGYIRISGGRIDMGACEYVDSDNDRLSDYEEDDVYQTNPDDDDTDNDGIDDGAELGHWADNWDFDYDDDASLFPNNLCDQDSDGDSFFRWT